MLFVPPAPRVAASAGLLLGLRCRPRGSRRRHGVRGRPRPTPSSRSPTACTPRSGSCRGSRSSGSSACRATRRVRALPDGVEASAFDEVPEAATASGHRRWPAELDALDRDRRGLTRIDHGYPDLEGRIGFLFRDRDGRAVGYGYSSEAGRVGPIAVRDAALLGPVLGHLIRGSGRAALRDLGPRNPGEAVVPLLRAGFRFDGFPVLLCWDRPFADFARYLPVSPGLL